MTILDEIWAKNINDKRVKIVQTFENGEVMITKDGFAMKLNRLKRIKSADEILDEVIMEGDK